VALLLHDLKNLINYLNNTYTLDGNKIRVLLVLPTYSNAFLSIFYILYN